MRHMADWTNSNGLLDATSIGGTPFESMLDWVSSLLLNGLAV